MESCVKYLIETLQGKRSRPSREHFSCSVKTPVEERKKTRLDGPHQVQSKQRLVLLSV